MKLKIPPGTTSGQTLRLAGQGEPGRNGGPSGDLLIAIDVAPSDSFHRDGKNIRSDVHVPVAVALLGGKVDVPTLHGTVVLTIPAGTSSDKTLRIRGQGVASSQGDAGDHLVRVVIDVPTDLSDEAKSAIREGKVKRAPSLAEQSSSSISVSVSGDHAAPDWLPQLKAIRSKLAAALEA